MGYAKTKIKIPLCKTDAVGYGATKDAEIVIVKSARECLAHYVDLNTVSCLKPLCEICGKKVTARGIYSFNSETKEQHNYCSEKCRKEGD